MNFDRNTVIGFVLLALLFFGFFYFNSKEQAASKQREAIQKAKDDSIKRASQSKPDSVSVKKTDSTGINANQVVTASGEFQKATAGREQLTSL